MKTISINDDNDMMVVDKQLQLSTGLQACLEVCKQAMQTVAGELVFLSGAGIPYFDVVFGSKPNIVAFKAHAKDALLAVDGVTGVDSLTASVSGDTLTYSVNISTTFGTATLTS